MNASHDQDQLTLSIGSSASEMADAVMAVQAFLDAEERKNEYVLMLVFRELVGNAIEHGNRGERERTAEIILNRLGEGRFQLRVRDEGEGFNHAALDLALPGGSASPEGRGLPLVNSLADELRFNETGNEATALLTLPQKTIFHIENDGEWRIVRPDKDIVGEAAEDFRTVLLELVEQGGSKFRFDLTKVEEVDSISLSLFVVFSNMLNKRGSDPELEIVGAAQDISRLFHMTRLSRTYRFVDQGA